MEKESRSEPARDAKPNKHWILWTLLAIFVVGSIGLMLAADILFAPEFHDPAKLPEAVGK